MKWKRRREEGRERERERERTMAIPPSMFSKPPDSSPRPECSLPWSPSQDIVKETEPHTHRGHEERGHSQGHAQLSTGDELLRLQWLKVTAYLLDMCYRPGICGTEGGDSLQQKWRGEGGEGRREGIRGGEREEGGDKGRGL